MRSVQIDAVVIGGLVFASSTASESIQAQANYFVDDNGAIISTHTCKVVSMMQPQPETL